MNASPDTPGVPADLPTPPPAPPNAPAHEAPYRPLARPMLAVYWPALAIATHLPGDAIERIGDLRELLADKLLHFGAFGLLTAMLVGASPLGRHRRGHVAQALAAGLIAMLYAVLDEATQPAFGRTADAMDLVADFTGVGVVTLAALLTPRIAPRDHSTGGEHRFVGDALLTGALTMVSRVLGLVRDAVLAGFFGLGAVTDAFFVAFMVPNLFRRLFGEGALSAAFIPTYAALLQRDHALARRLATAIVAGVAAFVGLLTVLIEVGLYVALTAKRWSYDTELAIRLTMIMLPFTPMICTVALVGGVLQVKGRFASQNIAPTLMNLVVIAATLLACAGVPANSRSPMIHVVAASVVLAGVIQLVWVIGSAWRLRSFGLGLSGLGGPTLAILRMMGPMVLGLGVLQINTLMDNVIAMALSPKQGGPPQLHLLGWRFDHPIPDNGAVAALTLAQRLYQFPIGVFAVALATAIFPALARAASPDDQGKLDTDAFRRILANGLRLTLFIGLPASLGLVLVRVPLSRIIFERGAFGTPDALRVAGVLAAYSAAVWAYSITQVVTRAFYALQKPRAPLAISLRMVLLNVACNLSLVWVAGVSGLAWATSLCAIVQSVWLLHALSREVGHPVSPEVWRSWRRSAALSLAMAPPLLLASWVWDPAALTRTGCGLLLAGMVGAGILTFAGGALALKMPELRWLLKRRITA